MTAPTLGSGPTHPAPTGPPSPPRPSRALADHVAEAERLGAQLLTALDPDVAPPRTASWWFIHRARELVGDALSVLGQIQTPARRDLSASNCAAPVATTGGPVHLRREQQPAGFCLPRCVSGCCS